MENLHANILTTDAPPEASSMIETFRAIGYSIETAVADIIDNSITANAQNIWIDYDWNGPLTILSVSDDGHGMNNEELVQAMKPGSTSPLDVRKEHDLGRFGLGLKTASFSQCRKFAVLSLKEQYQPVYWSWDLDYVNQQKSWSLIRFCPAAESYLQKLKELEHGTAVVWWDIDRLTTNTRADDEQAKKQFLATMEMVKRHLGMVFHRFIDEGLNIFLRGRKIEAWDPFMIGAEGLQTKPVSVFENGKVKVKGFVLPHRSKLSPDQYLYGSGPGESWTNHQGFYVYRNKRLLVAGDWLGFFKKEVHYDLCRIRIDLTNDLDEEWQIDIKKSIARPPSKLKEYILSIAKEVRAQALEVYRHKGQVIKRKLAKKEYFPFWEERTRHGKRFYKLNRNHPLIKELKETLDTDTSRLEQLLQFIEETVPAPLITLQESENEKPHGQPFEGADHNAIKETMQKLFDGFVSSGLSIEKAKARILNTEPYNFYPEYIEFLINE
ncbi:MAG: ATP-binding protein [bacterium]